MAVQADFSGIGIRVSGLGDAMSRRLENDWVEFLADESERPLLRATAVVEGGEVVDRPFRPKAMTSALTPHDARFEMPQGCANVDREGVARIRLYPGPGDTPYFTLMNLLRACLAWSLPARGAAMLHAAGLIVDGRAFVLVGPEGSGKTTWVRLGEQAGGRPLSDDLVLVQCEEGEVEALGSPLRSRHERICGPGRWPLAGVLFPRHGTRVGWTRGDALAARARLAANLPFVSEGIGHDERIASVVERLATAVPCCQLTFAEDPGFMELLRSGELPGG